MEGRKKHGKLTENAEKSLLTTARQMDGCVITVHTPEISSG